MWPTEQFEFETPGIKNELLCEIDATSIINKFAKVKSLKNAILNSRFAAFDNRLRHMTTFCRYSNDQIC